MKILCYCYGGIGYSVTMKETIRKILDEEGVDGVVDNVRLSKLKETMNDYDYIVTGKLFIRAFEPMIKSIKDRSKFIYLTEVDSYEKTKEDLIRYKIIKGE